MDEKKYVGVMSNGENTISDVEESEDFDLVQKQNARSFLRQRFLKIISVLAGKRCELAMYENINVKGTFCCFDSSFTNSIIKNLETPFGVQPAVIIRNSDLIFMKINDNENS